MRAGAFPFAGKWAEVVKRLPETGMGYTVVTVTLRGGRHFDQAVVDTGYLARIRGLVEVPFTEDDIAEIRATHAKWDWSKEGQGDG